MPIQKLTDVPEHIWDNPTVGSSVAWQSDYNIAAWIRYNHRFHGAVRLFLMWQDNSGEHRLCVDQADVSSISVLLSGIAHIKAQGPLQSLSIGIDTPGSEFVVDELFVQPTRSAPQQQRIGLG